MPLESGTRLGPYEILAPLGAGGMGEVYRARDTRLDRTVAVKVLPAHLSESHEARQRFEREARAVSSLNHPHICVLHDVGRHDGVDFLVMEHLEGETLAARLERGPLPAGDLMRCAVQIADALDKAHRQGVIHRDLKPGNVMLTKSGAKLLDFGLAKSAAALAGDAGLTISPTLSRPLTAEGSIVGTFQYMAPEQLEGREADARSDIFAFGTVLYEMATGRRAFQGKSQAGVIAAILHVDPPSIASLQPLSLPALERVVGRCLAKDPEERWQSVRDLVFELQSIAAAGPHPEAAATATPAPSRISERYLWLLLVGLLGGGAAGFGFEWYGAVSAEPRVVRSFVPAPEGTLFRSSGFNAGPAALSPDGTRLIFSARKEPGGRDQLWLRPLDAVAAVPLPGTEDAAYPFWSPDGRSIGFFAEGKLKRIDAAGGPAITVCDAPNGRGGTWSPEGVILFSPTQSGGLQRVPQSGGAPEEVTTIDKARGENTHRWPHFLPGGRSFLYFSRITAGDEGNSLVAGSLDGGDSRIILRTESNAAYASGHLLFVRERTLMAQPFDLDAMALEGDAVPVAEGVPFDTGFGLSAFSVSENGVLAHHTGAPQAGSQLVWLDRSGKQTGALGEPAIQMDLSLSPDLGKVSVATVDPRFGPPDVWIYEVDRGVRTRFTFEATAERSPVWSPDGTRIVFASLRSGTFDIFVKSYAGSGSEEALLEAENDQFPESWSSDGRYLAYHTRGVPRTGFDIWVLPLTGDTKPIPFLATPFAEFEPQFSPDGRWIAYTSDESGREEVYAAPFPGPGRSWQISSAGGSRPRWRGDGREIFYLADDNWITAVEVGSLGSTLEVGAAKPLFLTRPQRPGSIYRATPDGQRFLVNTATAEDRSDPIALVVNWTTELKKKR